MAVLIIITKVRDALTRNQEYLYIWNIKLYVKCDCRMHNLLEFSGVSQLWCNRLRETVFAY